MNCPACHQDKPRGEFRVYQRWSGRTFPTALCCNCRRTNRRRRHERVERFRNGQQVVDDPAYADCLRRRLEQVTFSWGKCACGRAGQLLDGRCLACQQHRPSLQLGKSDVQPRAKRTVPLRKRRGADDKPTVPAAA